MIESTVAFLLSDMRDDRLYPLTKDLCSQAIPFGGKYRLVDFPISNCLNNGLWRIFVLTQYNSFTLHQHIKRTYRFDSFSSGYVDILAAEQNTNSDSWYEGTADAVRKVFRYPKVYDAEYVLILTGQQLHKMDFRSLLSAHKQSGSALTVAGTPAPATQAADRGILKTNGYAQLADYFEKPFGSVAYGNPGLPSDAFQEMNGHGGEYLTPMGVYVFNRDTLAKLLHDHPLAMDFEKDIIPIAIKNGMNVNCYEYSGYFAQIRNIRSYHEVSMELASAAPGLDIYDQDMSVYSEKQSLPAPKVLGTIVQSSIISEGSLIEAQMVDQSIIGRRTRIGKAAWIMNSIVMGDDYYPSTGRNQGNGTNPKEPLSIGNHCVIENAIIGKNCRIGDHVRIIGGDDLEDREEEDYSVVDGIVVVHNGVTIPDRSTIGLPEISFSNAI